MRSRKRVNLDKFITMEDGLYQLELTVSDMKLKRDFLKGDIVSLTMDIKDGESLIKEIERDKNHQYNINQKLLYQNRLFLVELNPIRIVSARHQKVSVLRKV